MTEKELCYVQNELFKEYFNSDERLKIKEQFHAEGTGFYEMELLAFVAGWRSADAFADELSQPVTDCNKFGKSEQLNHIPDATKMVRTQAAIAAMQGLLSNPDITHRYSWRDIAGFAITNANCLLEELDKMEDQ